jgi:hypothetical protein
MTATLQLTEAKRTCLSKILSNLRPLRLERRRVKTKFSSRFAVRQSTFTTRTAVESPVRGQAFRSVPFVAAASATGRPPPPRGVDLRRAATGMRHRRRRARRGHLRMRVYRRTVADTRLRDMRHCGCVAGAAKMRDASCALAEAAASGRHRLHAKPTFLSTERERPLVPRQKPPSQRARKILLPQRDAPRQFEA